MTTPRLALIGCVLAALLAGCGGDRQPATRPAPEDKQAVTVPPAYEVVDSLFFTAPGVTVEDRLEKKLGDVQAGEAVLAVTGGEGAPLRTLINEFDWVPSEEVATGKVRLFVPAMAGAEIAAVVDDETVWQHAEDGTDVLSPTIDLGDGRHVLVISVRGTGSYGVGGVSDVLILRSKVPAATRAAAARIVPTATVKVRVITPTAPAVP